jgi:hypothetical protein
MNPQQHQQTNYEHAHKRNLGDKHSFHPEPPTFQDLQDDPVLEAEFSHLGFDLKDPYIAPAGSSGPFSVLTHSYPHEEPGGPSFLLQFRFIVGSSDRIGEIIQDSEKTSGHRRVIAIQVACIHRVNPDDQHFRVVFEKTYAIGRRLPHKRHMIADIVRVGRAYVQQVRNIHGFFQASQPPLRQHSTGAGPN